MNLYDKKIVRCVKCGKQIGEIDLGTKVVYSVCQSCESKNSEENSFGNKDYKNNERLNKRMIETVPC